MIKTVPHFPALRSLLCVPADSERFIARAAQRGADAVVLDLEDGVAPSAKDAARAALHQAVGALQAQGAVVHVRVNHDERLAQDLAASVCAGADGVVVPKLESAAGVARIAETLASEEQRTGRAEGRVRILALIETPLGFCRAWEIAQASPRLVSMGLGSEDFSTAMGLAPSPEALSGPAQSVAIAAVAAGLHPIGLPGPVGDFTDLDAYRRLVERARTLGLCGAICIHPAQVRVLNEVMGGSAAEIAAATRVVAVFDAAVARGLGAIALDGRMIDAPIANRARALLARAGQLTMEVHPT